MLDKMHYINHLNQRVDFGEGGIYIYSNSVRDYEWKYSTISGRVTKFKKDVKPFELPIMIISDEKNEVANSMFEIFERDVNSNEMGKLWIGEYYLPGYFIADKTSDFVYEKFMRKKLKFVTNAQTWIKSKVFLFRINNSALTEDGLGYPFDYPYDFISPLSIQNFTNDTFVDANFKMTIYGPVEKPMVAINGAIHQVNTTVNANEFLTIDSKNRTIVRTSSNGTKINEFASRNKLNDVFALIPPGTNKVVLNADFNVDITVFEERSEPKWI